MTRFFETDIIVKVPEKKDDNENFFAVVEVHTI